ncbi:MAG TPA: metallophosphoesterase family protein [Chlamydiales bacterium]|nr:metallophosphoesterase family protein [Chlamydiales bacterium]
MRVPLLFSFLLAAALHCTENITALYLSWYGDPTTTMTIQWHSDLEEDAILYQKRGEEKALRTGTHHPFPEEDLFIHTVTLEELEPDTEYSFQINEQEDLYTFRTAPATLNSPLRFIIGGDLYLSPKLFRKMGKTLLKLDPLFAVLGGDLAYALGLPLTMNLLTTPARQWRNFLADWKETFLAANNRLIPFLVAAGNHDITPDQYELFFSLFAFPKQELYRAIDFGSYLSLILLDTGHFQPIDGRQTLWLEKTLSKRSSVPYLFAAYHEGAYPSHYPYNGTKPKKIRTHWCPLFDKYHVQAAFEHHNHTYKKTYPLKAGAIDPEGTLYFGDGCWGVYPRKTFNDWYLDIRSRKNNAYFIELDATSASIKALGLNGEILDDTKINPK